MNNALTKYRSFWICLGLTLVTAAVFYQVYTHDFISYDDYTYVYKNPNIQAGITPDTIKWAFTTGRSSNWHPLTWLSHMLDWQLFGANPAGHHVTNLVFHIANTLLLFIVLKQMTRRPWPSAFVAALFAFHPLHVESVAWVAERKDVLSIFFWMLTMWAYVRFVSRPKIANYLLVVVFFALGLMSKPMLVTLPFVLLLLDYWPLDRLCLTVSPKRKKTGTKYSLAHLVIEKVPLFVMVLASSVITFIVQQKGGAMRTTEEYGLFIRLANASISYLQYIIKMIWPIRLAMFYPHPGRNVSILYAVISVAILLAVTILVLRFAKDHRYLVTGWFWYIGTLVPVIGLVQVGDQAFSDRYSYITLTGLFIIIAWGLPELLVKLPHRKAVLWVSSLIVLSVLAVFAHIQQRYWKDSITLYQHALEVTDDNYQAHFCMTEVLREKGRIEEAIWHNTEAVRIKPNAIEALSDFGVTLYKAGRIEEAIYYFKRAIQIKPGFAEANANLGLVLAAQGKLIEAVRHYKIAAETIDAPQIHSDLGDALLNLGRFQEAVVEYRKVLSATPNNPEVLERLGYSLAHSGKFDEAISLYNEALQIAPELVGVRINLGFALVSSGKFAEAAEEYKKVLLVQPQNASVHNDLGVALSQQGRLDEAIAHFYQAVRIDPNFTNARDNLNSALAEKQKLQYKGAENTKE